MSDAFAAALWAGDYMLQLASLGCEGVNLHGGVSAFLTAGLGDHTPGIEVAKAPQKVRSGFYTPISSEPGSAVRAMPVFYGMLLANQFAGGIPLDVKGLPESVNATAYAARDGQGCKVAIFNKDERQGLDLSIHSPGKVGAGTAWRLEAPGLDSTLGVTLAGAPIADDGVWSPRVVERIAAKGGMARIQVPASSAVLLFLR